MKKEINENLRDVIRELIKDTIKELSVTANAGAYQTPGAFSKDKKAKGTKRHNPKSYGWEDVERTKDSKYYGRVMEAQTYDKYSDASPQVNVDRKTVDSIKNLNDLKKVINKFQKDKGEGRKLYADWSTIKRYIKDDKYYIKQISTNTAWNEKNKRFGVDVAFDHKPTAAYTKTVRGMGPLD